MQQGLCWAHLLHLGGEATSDALMCEVFGGADHAVANILNPKRCAPHIETVWGALPHIPQSWFVHDYSIYQKGAVIHLRSSQELVCGAVRTNTDVRVRTIRPPHTLHCKLLEQSIFQLQFSLSWDARHVEYRC